MLLVTVKLLLPGPMAQVNEQLSAALRQNIDVKAVFSAVGKAISGQESVGGTLDEVYQAVFHPERAGEALETAADIPGGIEIQTPSAMDSLREYRQESRSAQTPATAEKDSTAQTEVATLAYVLYSDQNLPENVSMEQSLLGFDYCTPVFGVLSSGFGYREHPVEGEERFHYGVDLAADPGTDIACFADGRVTAVGESSSYGKYLIVEHAGGYATLYAHCSRVMASSGTQVDQGEKIAEVGETGMATGPHLHFELHRDNTYLNPIYYVSST
ncbi:MAG: M23 family metallopeptidase [Oscillibacter sp.]